MLAVLAESIAGWKLADVGEAGCAGFEGYLGDVGGEADGVVPAAEHGYVEDLLLVEGC